MTDHARQIEYGRYPDDDGTVEVHAAAVEHVIHTSRAQGITAELPELIRSLLERGIAAGHGTEGIASIIEIIMRPG